jgi:PhnB protein
MVTLSTYVLFDGTCKEAMEFYRSCLGGELSVSLVRDTPMKSMFPPTMHSRVINAHLNASGISLSASDWMLPNERPVSGNTVCLFVSGGTVKDTRSLLTSCPMAQR